LGSSRVEVEIFEEVVSGKDGAFGAGNFFGFGSGFLRGKLFALGSEVFDDAVSFSVGDVGGAVYEFFEGIDFSLGESVTPG